MAKDIKKNYIYNLLYQGLLMLMPLVVAPYLARVLGADGVGQISYVESVAAYFVLIASMGVSLYGQREISYHTASKAEMSRVFWNTKLFTLLAGMPVFLMYAGFSLFQGNRAVYLAFSLNILSVIADVTWLYQGTEEFGQIVAKNALVKVLSVLAVFLFVKDKEDILLYAVIYTVFPVLGNASLWVRLPRYIEKVPLKELKPFKDFKTILSLFVPTVAIQVYSVLDKTMIGLITHSEFENGYYEQAIKAAKMLLAIVTALGTVVIPRIGKLFEQGEKEAIVGLMYRSYRFVWFLGIPICLGLITVAPNFVPWFYGDGYDKVVPLLQILSLLILAIGINNVTGMQYLIPTKRQNLFTLTVSIGAAVNFCLNMLLIRYFQSIGAAVASVAAETVIALVQLWLVRGEMNMKKIAVQGIPYGVAGAIMAICVWLLGRAFTPSVLHTLMMAAAGVVIYCAVLLLLKDSFFISNAKDIFSKIKKRM